jgi:hypothetical protein
MTKTVGPPLLLVLAAALAFAGCVARPDVGAASPEPITTAELPPSPAIETAPSITPMTAEDFWASLFDGDRDFATYPSMQALAMDADAVVIASFASLERGPTYTDQYGNVMYEGALTLSIDRVLHGVVNTRTPGTLVVLVNLGFGFAEHAPDPWQERLASLQAAVPLGRGVFLLGNQGAQRKFNDFLELVYQPDNGRVMLVSFVVQETDGPKNLAVRPDNGRAQIGNHVHSDRCVVFPVGIFTGIRQQHGFAIFRDPFTIKAGIRILRLKANGIGIAFGLTG